MLDEKEYPNNIAIIRRVRGLSQAYVAEQIGVSRPKYIDIEKGLKELTLSQLEKLKTVLGADTDDLIGIDTGRFNFHDFFEKPNPPHVFIDLGIRTVWDDQAKEWLVPAEAVVDLLRKDI